MPAPKETRQNDDAAAAQAAYDMQQLIGRMVESVSIPGDDGVQWTNGAKAAIAKIAMAQLDQLLLDLEAFAK